jgi:hypothetical protein
MLLRDSQTIDELLADSLVQAAMRADNVELHAIRTVLADAADRVAAVRLERESKLASGLFANPRIDRWATPRDANGRTHGRPQPLADRCGSAFCC